MHPVPSTFEPSDEQLHAAWRAMAKPDWGTLEQAARAAAHFALVRAVARRQALGLRPDAAAQAASRAPEPFTAHATSHHSAPPLPRTPPGFDRMRAASGEREDD